MSELQQHVGERIAIARKAAGMTQQELAEKLGEKRGRIVSEWEHGISPNANKLMRIARVLDVSPNYLMGWDEGPVMELSPIEQRLVSRYRDLDTHGREVVSTVLELEARRAADVPSEAPPGRLINIYPLSVSAGRGIDLVENFPEPILVPKTPLSERADFVLRVAGDSMEPEYSDGDLILVRQTPALDPGSLGVFGLNGEGYFKRLGETALISMNPAYNPIPLNESLITFGEVLGKTEAI